MKYAENVLGLIGKTPLVKLNRMVDETMATVLVKMEQLNPAGSVKDRMAVNMLRRAEEAGLIQPGATIIESTSGNTGLGLAMACAVMPEVASRIVVFPGAISPRRSASRSIESAGRSFTLYAVSYTHLTLPTKA